MANVKSVNGDQIVLGTSGLEDGAVTGDKLDGSISREISTIGNIASSGFSLDGVGCTSLARIVTSTGQDASSTDHYASPFIPVIEGQRISYRLMGATDVAALIAEYGSDSYSGYIQAAVVGNGYSNPRTGIYTVPSGVKYIRVCTLRFDDSVGANSRTYFAQIHMLDSEQYEPSRLAKIYELSLEDNLLDSVKYISKHVINPQGKYAYTTTTYLCATEMIPVIAGMSITYALALSTSYTMVAEFDSGMNLVRQADIGTGGSATAMHRTTYVVPDGVSYVAFSFVNTIIDQEFIKFEMPSFSDDVVTARNAEAISAMRSGRIYDFTLNSELTPTFSILFFTDIHGTADSLERIVGFMGTNESLIDDAICTGDLVQASIASGMAFWDSVDGSEKILITPGNHDTVTATTGGRQLTQTEVYENYIEPYAQSWGGAVTVTNKSWWYKDYSAQKVRLIGLGSSYNMQDADVADEVSWLVGVLSAAKTLGYTVIVAQHYMPSDPVYMDVNFTMKYGRDASPIHVKESILDAIDDFMEAGGKFAFHLCGHTHKDQVVTSESHAGQLFLNATTASSNYQQQQFGDLARSAGIKSEDAFNVVVVDTNRTLVKMVRVGADRDMTLRQRRVICIDYSDLSVVYEG